MKLFLFVFMCILSSCNTGFGPAEATYDNFNYESITNEKGTVMVKLGDTSLTYQHATVVYSEADASTMLIKTKENKYVYIQGPAVIEFDTLNANP
jgi:hypothetical protein